MLTTNVKFNKEEGDALNSVGAVFAHYHYELKKANDEIEALKARLKAAEELTKKYQELYKRSLEKPNPNTDKPTAAGHIKLSTTEQVGDAEPIKKETTIDFDNFVDEVEKIVNSFLSY